MAVLLGFVGYGKSGEGGIRTIGTPQIFLEARRSPRFTFRDIRLPRDRELWFESISLQRRVSNEFEPRIVHPWPNQRFVVKHPRWEQDAGILCGGAQ
jgi:hypothetical protein